MIDPINNSNYGYYTMVKEQIKSHGEQKGVEASTFNIQEILDQIEEYTYTDQDKSEVDFGLMKEIKEQLNITEAEVYELYKRGVDLEQLSLSELAYRSKTKEKLAAKEDKSLEEKIEVIKKQNDSMYLYALDHKESITINGLYESNFKGEFKKGISQYSKKDVENVLAMNGLESNSQTIWGANLLMMYDMGVTSQRVSQLQSMKSAIATLDIQKNGHLSGEDELVKQGQVQYQKEYIDRITDDLGMVTDEHIEKLIEEGKDININELRESIHKNAEGALNEDKVLTDQVQGVKRQIKEIRAKLTMEAAQKISVKMPLESSELSKVANELLHFEEEVAIESLKEVNLPVTEENFKVLTDVMHVTDDMKAHLMETVQIELRTDERASLNDIQVALQAYGQNETPVELRFGESIAKVENQIEELLNQQEIETTNTNIDAAKALITNKMEVNQENLQRIQEMVIKLNTFLEEMTPVQVASLIKEGVNPYESSVDELLKVMSSKKIEGLKNSVAETIVSMETNGEISMVQKEGMIGFYRIIEGVSRHKEEVMGYLFRNELPLNMENLQMATKYATGKNRIEVTVDDSFGEIEYLSYSKETSKQLLESSFENASKTVESIKVLENMSLPITQDQVDKVSKMSALLYPYIKEQFKKDLGTFEGMGSLPESFLEKLESVQKVSPDVLNSMLEQKIPLTISNIYWMDKIANDPSLYGELLEQRKMLKEELPINLETLEEELMKLENNAKKQKEQATLKGNIVDYKAYKQIQEVVQFQRERIEKEGIYQIPFIIEGERRLINLYIHKDETHAMPQDEMHLKAVMTYETKHLGTLKAYLEMKGENIGYKVEAENEKGTQRLEAESDVLLSQLKAMGYNVQYSEFTSDTEEKVNTTQRRHQHDESNFEEMI